MPRILAQQPEGPGLVRVPRVNTAGLVRPDTLYTITAILDLADQTDPTLAMEWVVIFDGNMVVDEVKVCGEIDRSGASVPPSIAFSTPGIVPDQIDFTVQLPRPVNIGFNLDFGSVVRLANPL